MTTLIEFIRENRRKKSAEILGLELSTIDSYLYNGREPRPDTARKIIRRSNGELTWESIYGNPTNEAA